MIRSRNHSLDILRILACIMVVFMHAPLPEQAVGNGWLLSSLSYFTAPCIGLFFMVSGSLLLPVKTATGDFLRKRFSKILFPTLVWSLFYLICNQVIKGEETNWWKAVVSLPFSAQGNPVLWFMYTLMGLYLLVPILSRWLAAASQKEVEGYLLLWAVSLCYPMISLVADCNTGDTGILYYFTGYAGYFLLGYYLKKYPQRIAMKWILLAMAIAIAAPVVCKLLHWQVDFYSLFWYLSLFVVIQCVCWYQAVVRFMDCRAMNPMWANVLEKVSNLSFGIYLIHIFVMRYLLWNWSFIRSIDSYLIQTLTIALLTFVLSVAGSYLISFLPAASYIIGYKNHKSFQ